MTKMMNYEETMNVLTAQLPEISNNRIEYLVDDVLGEDMDGNTISAENLSGLVEAIKASSFDLVLLLLSGSEERNTDLHLDEVIDITKKHLYEVHQVEEYKCYGSRCIDRDSCTEEITKEIIEHLEKDFDYNDGCSTYFWGNGYIVRV